VTLPCNEDVAALAAFAVFNGTTVRAMPVSAPNTVSKVLRCGRLYAAALPLLGDIVDLHSARRPRRVWLTGSG
jgi:hypothetical protein